MSDARLSPPFDPVGSLSFTPAGIQAGGELRRRRIFMLSANLATYLALAATAATVLGAGGWTMVDAVLFGCFLIATPWTVLGFWNAAVGLWLLHGHRDGMREVAPFVAAAHAHDPIRLKTAV